MNRRTFLQTSAVALGTTILLKDAFALSRPPVLYGDGIHDDSTAFEAWLNGMVVVDVDGKQIPIAKLDRQILLLTRPVLMTAVHERTIYHCELVCSGSGSLHWLGKNCRMVYCIVRRKGEKLWMSTEPWH